MLHRSASSHQSHGARTSSRRNLARIGAALDFVRKYKFGQVVILSIQDFVQSLRGQTRGANRIDGAALEARVLRSGVAVVACFHLILQLQRHFLLGDPDTALEFAAKAKPLLWSARLNIQSVDYCFYHSLALAAVFPTAPPERQTELREALTENLHSLERWAESCPESFSHKHALVAAEAARLEGREFEAMRLYEQRSVPRGLTDSSKMRRSPTR